MSFFPVRQSETRQPGANPPFTLDFQHLEEWWCCCIAWKCVCVCVCVCVCASCVSRLGAELVCCRPVIDCSPQHYRNIHSFSSDPYTQGHCTHTFLCTHTHTHTLILSILFLWPMLTQDIRRPKEQTKSWQHQVAWLAAKGQHRLTKCTAHWLLWFWTAHVVKCFHYSVSAFCIHQQQKAPSCTLVFSLSRLCSWSGAGLNKMEERTIYFIWLSPLNYQSVSPYLIIDWLLD